MALSMTKRNVYEAIQLENEELYKLYEYSRQLEKIQEAIDKAVKDAEG